MKEEYHMVHFGVVPKVGAMIASADRPSVDLTYGNTVKQLEDKRRDGKK